MSLFGTGNFLMGSEMPHETTMEKYNIEFVDLSTPIQHMIRKFDLSYSLALEDGILTQDEYLHLYELSFLIQKAILLELENKQSPH